MGIMNNSSASAEEGVLSKGPHTEQRCPTLRTVTVYGYEFTVYESNSERFWGDIRTF